MSSRSFRWLPIDGARHAVLDEDRVPGEPVTTLAGEALAVPTARPGALEWLWPTCLACWTAAKEQRA